MTKINELRKTLQELPQSTQQGVVAGNSTVKWNPRTKEYELWCGGMQPKYSGPYWEIKEIIERNAED